MLEIKYEKESNRAVAYDNNLKIGECVYEKENNVWNIIHTGVDSFYQGQGIEKR